MALRKAFCPNCGQPTQIDDTKDFCFCLSCGNKINVPKREQPVIEPNMTVAEHEPKQRTQNIIEEQSQAVTSTATAIDFENKMKEAEFYYKLSIDKKEYADNNGEPTYYLKGQDLLVDLSQKYTTEYRVWWELCKPMDFAVIIAGEESRNSGSINSFYFDKALDLAPLEKKMELIKQHDKYLEVKNEILKEIQAEQEARKAEERKRIEEQQRKERAEEERRRIEQQRKEREAEEERQRIEQQRKKELAERERQERADEFARAQQAMSQNVWLSLASKDYSSLDNSYFKFRNPEGITIIATFKVITNVLYLNAFHMDANKNNTAYLDQSIAIHFSENGTAIKFDNRPVIVRGWNSDANKIQVMVNPKGGYMVNNIALVQDNNYVAGITKSAKKTFMSFKKIFD